MARRPYAVFLIPLMLLVLVLGACGSQDANTSAPAGETGGQAPAGMIDHLDFGAFGGGSNPQVNYNPYSPSSAPLAPPPISPIIRHDPSTTKRLTASPKTNRIRKN